MKYFNYSLYFLGGLFVAYIFYSFIATLGMFVQNLGRIPTQSDLSYYYAIRTSAVILGFVIGTFSFRHLLKD